MEAKDIVEVVNRLIGKTQVVGESHTDEHRLNNLKLKCEIIDMLIDEIELDNVQSRGFVQHSIRESYDYSSKFLSELKDRL